MMTRRRILIAAATLGVLMVLLPPWQKPREWGGGAFIGWRPLLRPPIISVPILQYEVAEGRMPPEALSDPATVEKYSSGHVSMSAEIAWDVLCTQWLALLVAAVGAWLLLRFP